MKYCIYCGAQLKDQQRFCDECGRSVYETNSSQTSNLKKFNSGTAVQLISFIFMIIGCVTYGVMLIPLIWCIPLTIKSYKRYKYGEPISIGCKVCSLIFVSIIGGICMLIDD